MLRTLNALVPERPWERRELFAMWSAWAPPDRDCQQFLLHRLFAGPTKGAIVPAAMHYEVCDPRPTLDRPWAGGDATEPSCRDKLPGVVPGAKPGASCWYCSCSDPATGRWALRDHDFCPEALAMSESILGMWTCDRFPRQVMFAWMVDIRPTGAPSKTVGQSVGRPKGPAKDVPLYPRLHQ